MLNKLMDLILKHNMVEFKVTAKTIEFGQQKNKRNKIRNPMNIIELFG
jgi:hypothetical protein